MKPISMELAGLQSYRERQTVDFEKLCEGGVFGIFGPTGSGKSSILDAMTLALYGKVERAGGTQGILNGAENKLSVSFTFELAGADETVRYRVERQYKRTGDASVSGTVCRLIELAPEGDRVLADKQREVDLEVRNLVGLEMTDFTRAVVLPQGKFAEFLSLGGKDRRQMLQRLFRLERYGDALAFKLSARADAAKLALKEAEAEQQGLGDASPAALEAAAERLASASAALETLRLRLAEADRRHRELTRRREREEELRRVEAALAKLDEEADAAAGEERRLDRLEKAAVLAPLLKDADDARVEQERRAAERAAAETALAAAVAAAGEALAGWQARTQEAERAEPELLRRLERLEQAVKLEEEAAQWKNQQADWAKALADSEADAAKLRALLAEENDRFRRGQAKQAELKARQEALIPLAEQHGALQAAAARKPQLEAARRQAEEAAREADELRGKERLAIARREEAARAADASAREGELLGAWWTGASAETDKLAARLARARTELEAHAQRLAGQEREEERRTLAFRLAEHLEDGAPCPVCGSAHHPTPAQPDGSHAEHEPLSAAIAEAQRQLAEIQRIEREVAAWQEKIHWYVGRLKERVSASAATAIHESSLPEAAAAWAEEHGAAPDGDIYAWWNTFVERSEPIARQQSSWETKRSELERESAQAANAEAGAYEARTAADSRASRAMEAAETLLRAWKDDFPKLALEEIESAAAQAADADREIRDLRDRLDKSVAFMSEMEQKRREIEQQLHGVQLRITEGKTKLESASGALTGVETRLREWTDGASPAALLQTTEDALRQLRLAVNASKTRLDESQAAHQAEAARSASALDAEKTSRLQSERYDSRLAEAITDGAFESEAEVRNWLPYVGEISALQSKIRERRETVIQLTAQAKLLREHADGEPLAPGLFEQSATELEALRSQAEEAQAERAKAERDLEHLTQRRNRWEELESRRLAVAGQASRIAQLQSVFRGNVFVEYVAEEQLEQVCLAASERLGYLTRRRYALEVDAGGGFVIRDDANGGLRRPVSTLSGGETFLTSLALALALSAQIQLRGRYPLQFFFLDEGFGTLDPELLETVVTSLEKLQHSQLAVGVISHVPELQARLPRRLYVTPAEPGGRGSRIAYETL